MVTIVTNQPLPNLNGGHDTVFGRQATAAQQMRQVLASQLKQTLRRSDWGPSLGSTVKSCPFPDDKRHQKTGKSSEAPRVYLELCLMVLVHQTLHFHQKDIIGFNSWK